MDGSAEVPWAGVLPEGVEYRFHGSVATLHFADEETRRDYLAVVGHDGKGALLTSRYQLQHALRGVGTDWHCLIEVLRMLAMDTEFPQPTIDDLAEALDLSAQTVRRMIQFWQRPSFLDRPEAEWTPRDRREWERWILVRALVPEIRQTHRNQRYAFKVLFGEVLDVRGRAVFARMRGLPQAPLDLRFLPGCTTNLVGQDAEMTLQFGTEAPGRPSKLEGHDPCASKLEGHSPLAPTLINSVAPSCPSKLEGQDSRPSNLVGHSRLACPSNLEGRPETEPCHGHGPFEERNAMAMASPESDSLPNPGQPPPDAPPAAARFALEQLGVPDYVIRLIVDHPSGDGPRLALLHCEWIAHCWQRIRDPTAYVIAAIRRACQGSKRDQEPPREWWAWQRAEEARKAAAAPGSAPPATPQPPPIAADLRRLWERARVLTFYGDRDDLLRHCRPAELVERNGRRVLYVDAPPQLLGELNDRVFPQTVAAAREKHPDFPDLVARPRGDTADG